MAPPTPTRFGLFFSSIRGWFFVFTTLLPPAATWIAGVLEQLPLTQRIPLIAAALAAGAALGHFTLSVWDRVAGWYGSRKEGLRVAKELRDMIAVGHTRLNFGELTEIWTGPDVSRYRSNYCLRRLKQAAELGQIKYEGSYLDKPHMLSDADLIDAVHFFENRAWLRLPPLQSDSPKPAPTMKPKIPRRSKWITGWRK